MKAAKLFSQVSKRVLVFIAAGTFALILMITGILVLRDFLQDRSINEMEQQRMAYDSSSLEQATRDRNRSTILYPEVVEELDLSPDPYRESGFKWDDKEVSRLWIEPDAGDIDSFSDANHKLIWDILKDAP